MRIDFSCKPANITPASILGIQARLADFGFLTTRVRATGYRFPETAVFNSLEKFVEDAQSRSLPKYFDLSLWGEQDGIDGSFHFSRDIDKKKEQYLTIGFDAPNPRPVIEALISMLELELEEPRSSRKSLARTAFIAHKFDESGTEAASKVARFLELLRFKVVTGRAYAPTSIAEKVRKRLIEQSIVIAILTPGDDATWLVQESLLAETSGKPLFLLKESTAAFRPGLLADHEFVPFELAHIEKCFVPLLEGLREFRFLDFER